MLRRLLLPILLIINFLSKAQEASIPAFIERYREIAVEEMHRTGIPASIKLAQAILESSAGTSELALNSNNHFGLKCGVDWDGGTYFKEDDDYDRRGRLIPSCFRAFESAEASFIAHSEFLRDPRKAYRYSWLFDLDRQDYKSWAWGLKQSGYATNPRYAVLLIKLIEDYELYTYDYWEPRRLLASTDESLPPEPPREKVIMEYTRIPKKDLPSPQWRRPAKTTAIIEGVLVNNGREMVYANAGDTPWEIAQRYDISLKDVLEYNERLEDADQALKHAERVYLEKKKKAYRGSRKKHVVVAGETMYDIAQLYGIRLERLYIRNRMFPGAEPAVGEQIYLRGMVPSRERPKVRATAAPEKAMPVFRPENKQLATGTTSVQKKVHVVQNGDTLYAIARRYDLSVAELKARNRLKEDLIAPGQLLYVE